MLAAPTTTPRRYASSSSLPYQPRFMSATRRSPRQRAKITSLLHVHDQMVGFPEPIPDVPGRDVRSNEATSVHDWAQRHACDAERNDFVGVIVNHRINLGAGLIDCAMDHPFTARCPPLQVDRGDVPNADTPARHRRSDVDHFDVGRGPFTMLVWNCAMPCPEPGNWCHEAARSHQIYLLCGCVMASSGSNTASAIAPAPARHVAD